MIIEQNLPAIPVRDPLGGIAPIRWKGEAFGEFILTVKTRLTARMLCPYYPTSAISSINQQQTTKNNQLSL